MNNIREYFTMREMIDDVAVKFSTNIAFRIKTRSGYDDITYARLGLEVRAAAGYIQSRGWGKKRIAIIGKNSYEWMLVYLSALYAGSVIVPLDKGLLDYEIADQIERSGAEAIFYAPEYEKMLEGKDIAKVCTSGDEFERVKKNTDFTENAVDGTKMGILLFTSGTTSKSKAVMLSERNILANVYGMSLWEDFRQDDVNMAILPFHHTFGMTQIILLLTYGICHVFCDGLRFAKCLNEYHVTILVCVPRLIDEIYSRIMKTADSQGGTKKLNTALKITAFLKKLHIDVRRRMFKSIIDNMGGKLRLIIVGAAAATPKVQDFFNNIGILAVQGYGLTETSPCISAENAEHLKRGSVGKAIPNVKVKIDSPAENGIGEIAVQGDNVMLGYYNDEESTAAVMKDGYFHTGDMGRMDEDGYIFITGRKKNVIVLANGKNVFPEELEMLINQSPAVKECIVMNKPHNGKDSIFAKIVYNDSLDRADAEKEISEHIKNINEKLILYKQIKDFELTDKEMEKTTTLKIKRGAAVK